MIVIAHRLSTIRDADNIIVMSKGEMLEQGTHSQLIGLGGAYSRLVQAQDLGDKTGAASDTEDDTDEKDNPDNLVLAPSHVSATGTQSATATAQKEAYGLLHGLYLILKEQPILWPNLGFISISCLVGGKFLLLFSYSSSL